MKNRLSCLLLILVVASACDDHPLDLHTPASSPATPGPEALWSEFQALHAEATPETAIAVGRRIDALLSDEARATYANAMTDAVRGLRLEPAAAANAVETLRYRLLGESAGARKGRMTRYRVGRIIQPSDDRATLDIRDGSALVMQLPAVRENGAWRFLPSSNLVANYDELYPLSEADRITEQFTSAKEAADGLAAALNKGTAWEVYAIFDARTKTRLDTLFARRGVSLQQFVRNLDTDMVALRSTGQPRVASITMTDRDHARIIIRYDDGHARFAGAVNERGSWRIQLPI